MSALVLDRQPGPSVPTEAEARLATHLGNYARWLASMTTLPTPDLGLMLIAGPLRKSWDTPKVPSPAPIMQLG